MSYYPFYRIIPAAVFFLSVFLALPVFAVSPESSQGSTLAEFRHKIKLHLDHPCLRAGNFGIKIVSLDNREIIYQHQSDSAFIPASNLKLITTAAALKFLGPDYRFVTQLRGSGEVKDGVLSGDLYLKGSGDPKLVTEQMWLLANELKNLPLRKVDGDLVADDSYFDGVRWVKTWNKNHGAQAYHAPLGALSFNFNTVKVMVAPGAAPGDKPIVVVDPDMEYIHVDNQATTLPAGRRNRLIVNRLARDGFNEIVVTGGIPFKGSRKRFYLSITNPALFTALTFKSFLAKAGIEFKGNVRMGKAPEDAALLVRHDSEPLALILRGLNKFSNNFVAEQLTKTLAADQFGPPGTTENGVKIIESYMKSLGYSPPRFTLVDGSGLSRQNRLSPDQIVSVLRAVYKDLSVYPELIASLAVMGLDGSVQDRMNGNPAARRARVKTGTLNSVSAISGYFQSQGGEKFVFSIMMNDLKCNNNAALKLQDKILREGLNFKRHLD